MRRLRRATAAASFSYYMVAQTGLSSLVTSCDDSARASEKEGIMLFGIPNNIATATMEEIYERVRKAELDIHYSEEYSRI